MAQSIHEADTINVRVTVYQLNSDGTVGAAYNLTGATLACFFGQPNGSWVTGTATVVSAASGIVDCVFPSGTAKYPNGKLQLEVTKSGVKYTAVDEDYVVLRSLSLQ